MKHRWLLLSLLLLAACGNAPVDEPENGLFNSGLDDSTRVADLDPGAASAFCDAVGPHTQRYFAAHKEKICLFQGTLAAGFAAFGEHDPLMACDETLAECRATFDTAPRACMLAGSSCTATVGQLEACYNETIALLDKVYEHLDVTTCQEIVDWTGEKLELSDPPACEPIDESCPQLKWGLLTQ